MGRKLEDLREFVIHLKKKGYIDCKIPDQELGIEIAEVFGISDYTQRIIRKALAEYKVMSMNGMGMWEYYNDEKGITKKELERVNELSGMK